MPLTGGLRDRMLVESVTQGIIGELTTIGWFSGGRQHLPVKVDPVFPRGDEQPDPNTLTIDLATYTGELAEMGSKAENRYTILEVHFWGEHRSITMELLGDIWAFLRTNPVLPVYDYGTVGDPIDFYVEVNEDSMRLDTESVNRAYEKFWGTLIFGVWDLRANG